VATFDDHLVHNANARGQVTLLPDPPAEELWCPIISVDDHALEPLDLFERRMPAALRDKGPKIYLDDEGVPYWEIDGLRIPISIGNGAAGRPVVEWNQSPAKLDEFRPAVSDPRIRVQDMDLSGVWASLCFPSIPWGFAGTRFLRMKDREAARAAYQAYNDWMLEEWCGSVPDRFIPTQLPWLADPAIAAEDIRANAARGFKAVSFSENPEPLGLPNVYTDHWDPFFAACEETGTVVCLHVGSSGQAQQPSTDSSHDVWAALFPVSAFVASIDWVFARVPIRFPNLKIALSEGGVSWVPMAIERLNRAYRQIDSSTVWQKDDPDPAELFRKTFYFCSLEDPSAFQQLDQIGRDHVMVETDYPHPDSTWPTMQALIKRDLGHLAPDDIRAVCYGNAARLYGVPAPPLEMLKRSVIGAGEEIINGK
jgi:predicted TIM-barrel fold metal-dependent hydrolase